MIPIAPPSNNRQMNSGVLAGTRTSGVMPHCIAATQIWQTLSIDSVLVLDIDVDRVEPGGGGDPGDLDRAA